MWRELSRSSVPDMTIPRSTEIERQQLNIFSKGYTHLSVDA
jgi:hypothetical protein